MVASTLQLPHSCRTPTAAALVPQPFSPNLNLSPCTHLSPRDRDAAHPSHPSPGTQLEDEVDALLTRLATEPEPRPAPPPSSFAEALAAAPPPEEEPPPKLKIDWGAKPSTTNWGEDDDDDEELDFSRLGVAEGGGGGGGGGGAPAAPAAPAAPSAGDEGGEVPLPLDWRSLPVFPTHKELAGGALQLPQALSKGSYAEVEQYLMAHFMVLREDLLAPLRAGIAAARADAAHATDATPATDAAAPTPTSGQLYLYSDVELVSMQCTARTVLYRIRFRARGAVEWARSKRLLHGSLLALSCDNFQTITWATVARRDTALLLGGGGGGDGDGGGGDPQIDISFPEAAHHEFQLAQARGERFVMAESPACFEVDRHVLQALQAFAPDQLPLAPTLLGGSGAQQPPAYLRGNGGSGGKSGGCGGGEGGDRYAMSSCLPDLPKATGQTGFRILAPWPELGGCGLDESQAAALKAALTREVALIHGAPGTGKSHVTNLALKALLANAAKRGGGRGAGGGGAASPPILVVCASSDGLDRLLEALVEQEPRLVRVGPRTHSEALKGTSLRARIAEEKEEEAEAKARRTLAKQQRALRDEIETLAAQLQQREPTADDIEDVANTAQIMSLCAAPDGWLDIEDALQLWLQPVRDAAQERTADLLMAGGGGGGGGGAGRPRRLVTGAAGERPKREESAKKRLVRVAGGGAADWAAVTRVEFADEDGEADEEWEAELARPTLHGPTLHGPTLHGPTHHGPTCYGGRVSWARRERHPVDPAE